MLSFVLCEMGILMVLLRREEGRNEHRQCLAHELNQEHPRAVLGEVLICWSCLGLLPHGSPTPFPGVACVVAHRWLREMTVFSIRTDPEWIGAREAPGRAGLEIGGQPGGQEGSGLLPVGPCRRGQGRREVSCLRRFSTP